MLAALLVAAACTEPAENRVAAPIDAEPTMQPDDLVDLQVYFRGGEGGLPG